MSDDRGGQILKTGKIGRVNCLRQQYMQPGEKMDLMMNGSVRLESLRERDSLRIHAHLATFMTPLRWLWPEFPDYLREGPTTSRTPPILTENDLSRYGIGAKHTAGDVNFEQYWRDACIRIYNNWYKWPEYGDAVGWHPDGLKAVPLQAAWSRSRTKVESGNASDYTVASATEFDVRTLAETQARFRASMDRDVLTYNRFMELVNEMYGTDGSREVDKVPMMIDQTEVGVNPREQAATDGASLGQWQSIFDFGVDHNIRNIVAPEHCIVTTMLVVRFAPITESRHALASNRLDWAERVGDPEILGAMQPQSVQRRDFFAVDSDQDFGYMPAGWQWRAGHDVIGGRIDARDSFPYMKLPVTVDEAKDATRINQSFRTQSLGDYVVDVYCKNPSRNRINTALESYFVGMTGSRDSSEIPMQGKML